MLNQSDWLLWWTNYLDGWGEISGFCLFWLQQGFWHCFSQHPHRQTQGVRAGCVDSEDWELTEWQIPEDHSQWHRVQLEACHYCCPLRLNTILGPVLFNLSMNDLDEGEKPPQQVHWWQEAGRSGRYHGGMGREEHSEIQQRQMQDHTPEEEQPHVQDRILMAVLIF